MTIQQIVDELLGNEEVYLHQPCEKCNNQFCKCSRIRTLLTTALNNQQAEFKRMIDDMEEDLDINYRNHMQRIYGIEALKNLRDKLN